MDKEIINPFKCFPANKKTNCMTKHFPLYYDENTNTYIMEGNNLRLINIPNDFYAITILSEYVCSYYINAQALTTSLIVTCDGKQKSKRVSLARIFAFLYDKIDDLLDYRSEAFFLVKHHYEGDVLVQDVAPYNICIGHDKEYLEDAFYTYFKIYGTSFYARVNNYVRDFFINQCTGIHFTEAKGVRSCIKGTKNTVSLNNIMYKFYNPSFGANKGVKLLNDDIQYNEQLGIYFKDYSISNLYYGNEVSVDDKYAYIFMPKYNVSTCIDKFIYEKHADEIMSHIWYINNDHVCSNYTKDVEGITLHRLIIKLLFQDYNIDFSIMRGITIHHIDEYPLNNTVDNFFICSIDVHSFIHDKLASNVSIIPESNVIEILTLGYIPELYLKIQK